MHEIGKLSLKLFAIAAIAGLLLGVTNAATAAPIAEQARTAAEESRRAVLPDTAETFTLVTETDGDVYDVYRAENAAGELVGFTAVTAVTGFGGPIEITLGMGENGVVQGVRVGGSDFAETAGLGARTKEAWFTDQFSGLTGPFALSRDGGEIDAVTSATVSSTAVLNGVNALDTYLTALVKEAN